MPTVTVVADDLGMSTYRTDAILHAFNAGAVTHASLLVGGDDAVRAARLARTARLPMSLHLNLTEGRASCELRPSPAPSQRGSPPRSRLRLFLSATEQHNQQHQNQNQSPSSVAAAALAVSFPPSKFACVNEIVSCAKQKLMEEDEVENEKSKNHEHSNQENNEHQSVEDENDDYDDVPNLALFLATTDEREEQVQRQQDEQIEKLEKLHRNQLRAAEKLIDARTHKFRGKSAFFLNFANVSPDNKFCENIENIENEEVVDDNNEEDEYPFLFNIILEELCAQLAHFEQLCGHFPFSIEGHHHVHVLPVVANVIAAFYRSPTFEHLSELHKKIIANHLPGSAAPAAVRALRALRVPLPPAGDMCRDEDFRKSAEHADFYFSNQQQQQQNQRNEIQRDENRNKNLKWWTEATCFGAAFFARIVCCAYDAMKTWEEAGLFGAVISISSNQQQESDNTARKSSFLLPLPKNNVIIHNHQNQNGISSSSSSSSHRTNIVDTYSPTRRRGIVIHSDVQQQQNAQLQIEPSSQANNNNNINISRQKIPSTPIHLHAVSGHDGASCPVECHIVGSLKACCVCLDKRPRPPPPPPSSSRAGKKSEINNNDENTNEDDEIDDSTGYGGYQDGLGKNKSSPRWAMYCGVCRAACDENHFSKQKHKNSNQSAFENYNEENQQQGRYHFSPSGGRLAVAAAGGGAAASSSSASPSTAVAVVLSPSPPPPKAAADSSSSTARRQQFFFSASPAERFVQQQQQQQQQSFSSSSHRNHHHNNSRLTSSIGIAQAIVPRRLINFSSGARFTAQNISDSLRRFKNEEEKLERFRSVLLEQIFGVVENRHQQEQQSRDDDFSLKLFKIPLQIGNEFQRENDHTNSNNQNAQQQQQQQQQCHEVDPWATPCDAEIMAHPSTAIPPEQVAFSSRHGTHSNFCAEFYCSWSQSPERLVETEVLCSDAFGEAVSSVGFGVKKMMGGGASAGRF